MTIRKAVACSMFLRISRCHSAVGGMSFESTQGFLLRAESTSASLRTKSPSLREYEMKTCGKFRSETIVSGTVGHCTSPEYQRSGLPCVRMPVNDKGRCRSEGLLGIATGTFVCIVSYSEKGPGPALQ